MDAIPPDIAKKLVNRDFANLVKRVQAGGKINRTERAILQSMAAGAGGDGPAFVRNFVELAAALKVSRQTINGWKKFEDAPKPEANGLHDVARWREFMRTRGLKGGEETPDIHSSLVFVDAGYATYDVYRECARRGWTALMGDRRPIFVHKTKAGRSIQRFPA